MALLADIVTGKTNLGDVFFLIAVVLAVLAALVHARPGVDARVIFLGWLALAFTALGLLVQ